MHDKNGKPLKKGDRVMVEAVITQTWASDTFCNITLALGQEAPNGEYNVQGTLVLNAKQVELIEE